MKICYIEKNFKPEKLRIIKTANEIISEFEWQGYTLTLRQLYYQFVGKDLIPNTERSYKNLGNLINDAKLAGLISWEAIEDRGRQIKGDFSYEEETDNVIAGLDGLINFDYWERQDNYVEVWVEKEALSDIIRRPSIVKRVKYMACKGYMSSSSLWEAGRRFLEARNNGKDVHLIHLGDHDPSGIDMTRDNEERLMMFSEGFVEVHRIALNMNQVEEYNLPPNPAKLSDSRINNYVFEHGNSSWELDALKPNVISNLIKEELMKLIDVETWDEVIKDENEERLTLQKLEDNWHDVVEFLANKDIAYER